MKYNDKHAIKIANLVETKWLTIYPRTKEITYHEFIKLQIEREYGILNNPITSGNKNHNTILEGI